MYTGKYTQTFRLSEVPLYLRLSSGVKNYESRDYAIIFGLFDPGDGAVDIRDNCRWLSHVSGAPRSGCL